MHNIYFTHGCMGSGKSAYLIESFLNDKRKKLAISVGFKETGTLGKVKSRNGDQISSVNFNCYDDNKLLYFLVEYLIIDKYEVIYFDEVQFFPEQTIKNIVYLCNAFNVQINFFGLKTTFRGKEYFESSEYLLKNLPIDNIYTISSFCEQGCFAEAEYNARIIDGKIIKDGPLFIEEKTEYKALCEDCFNK